MSHLEIPLEENINRIVPDEGTVEARTIEDAIAALRYCVFYGFCPLNGNVSSSWTVPVSARGLRTRTTTLNEGWRQRLPPMRRPTCLAWRKRTPTWDCRSWSSSWRRSGWRRRRIPSTNALQLTTPSEKHPATSWILALKMWTQFKFHWWEITPAVGGQRSRLLFGPVHHFSDKAV